MNILVTGGAGFIGTHLTDALIEQGNHVTILDNFSSGSWKYINSKANVIYQDVTEPFDRDQTFHQIYHLACPASPVQYQASGIDTVMTNVVGTYNMFYLALAHGARVLLTSTSEIYGEPLEHPQKESYRGNVNCFGPRSCYDVGKRCAETLAYEFQRQKGLDVRIARIFNTYGPRMKPDDGRVVSSFIINALQGQPISINGDGSQTRSFCYISDTVNGLIQLMNSNVQVPVNIGNPDEHTILELAQFILQGTESKSNIVFCNSLQDDPTRRKPDIRRAQDTLKWIPVVPLDVGLRQTIQHFSSQL